MSVLKNYVLNETSIINKNIVESIDNDSEILEVEALNVTQNGTYSEAGKHIVL